LRVLVALASRRVAASPGERLRSGAVLLLALGALGFLFLFNPATTSFYPACPFFWATGCYCPGCGSLRALHQLSARSARPQPADGALPTVCRVRCTLAGQARGLGQPAQERLHWTAAYLGVVGPDPGLLGFEERARLSFFAARALSFGLVSAEGIQFASNSYNTRP
jgi:hypothetical protein